MQHIEMLLFNILFSVCFNSAFLKNLVFLTGATPVP